MDARKGGEALLAIHDEAWLRTFLSRNLDLDYSVTKVFDHDAVDERHNYSVG